MSDNVFITGGCGLIGSAVAEAFYDEGYSVVVLDTNEAIVNLRHELPFETYYFDITKTENHAEALAELRSSFGAIQNWVNCAYPKTAGYSVNGLDKLDGRDWHNNTTAQLDSICLLSSCVAAVMASHGGGNIVNVASIYGMVSPRFGIYPGGKNVSPPVYSAIKAGIINYSRYLACYYAAEGVRVNCVSPGGVFNHQDPNFVHNYSETVPIGRMASGDEIAGPILFLCSEKATYVTGVNLPVDGGWTAM